MLSYFLVACFNYAILANAPICAPEEANVNSIGPEYVAPIIYLDPSDTQIITQNIIVDSSQEEKSIIQTFIIKK